MSGGSLNYGFHHLNDLADEIERKFLNDGKYTDDYLYGDDDDGKRDRIGDATPEERIIILDEVRKLIINLRRDAKRCKEIEWLLSGDTGSRSYLERLSKI